MSSKGNNKSITIIKGQEYKVCKINIDDENNFLYNSYLQALDCLEEIQEFREYTKNVRSNNQIHNKYHLNYENLNNIIAFCGERGQGKTSAMISFADILSNNKNNKFYVMKTIDPTSLEKNDNILMMILSCIFSEFENKWKSSDLLLRNIDNNNILELFQKAYHHISGIKFSSNKIQYSDFDEAMENLSKYGDSINLKLSFENLISEFMNYCGDKNGYFIIPIDDTDLNIERAFEIVEDIRKYLMIPNVVILMATKFEQLKIAVEQHFRQNFKATSNIQMLSDVEISKMASKYLDKLIPETRRINLPKVGIVDVSGNLPNIIYKENYDKYSSNILSNYGDNLQDQIINFIEVKTAIRFDTNNSNGRLHWIIPKTIRELVNLLALLSKMEDVKEDGVYGNYKIITDNDNNTIKIISIKNMYKNLNEFYTYFRTSWIVDNLDVNGIISIEKIIESNIHSTHMQTLLELKNMIEHLDDVIKETTIDKNTTLNQKIKQIFKDQSIFNKYNYSLGDVLDALMLIENLVPLDSVLKFIFAIKTIYTIKMILIVVNDIICKNDILINSEYKFSKDDAIIQFIGIDFLGKYNTSNLFPIVSTTSINRGRFEISINKFNDIIKAKNINLQFGSVEELFANTYLKKIGFCGYKNSNYNYFQDKSDNNRDFTTLYCNVSYFFLYVFMNINQFKIDDIFNLLNIEKILNIVLEQMQIKDKKKGKATLKNMYSSFFQLFKDFSFCESVIKELKDDEKYIAALDIVITSE